jgi:hypothetical protein
MKDCGPVVSPKSRIGSNMSSEADIAIHMLDHTNNKSMRPDSLSTGKVWSEALERDYPAN